MIPERTAPGCLIEPQKRDPRRRALPIGFWLVGAVFTVTIATGSAPAPLYVLYQRRDDFPVFILTVIFAVYAAGVAVGLLTAGHLSDRLGRRRILTVAVLLSTLAMLIFMTWSPVPALIVARFISGLGIGMLTATATAYLTDLDMAAHPPSGSNRADVVATAASLGGLGLGPLVAGLLAEYAPDPLYTPYAVFVFLLVISALLVATVPETVEADPTWRYRLMRVAIPAGARTRYIAALSLAFTASAVFGLFTSLAPGFLSTVLGISSLSMSGAVTFLVLASAAGFQLLGTRRRPDLLPLIGTAFLGPGLLVLTLGLTTEFLPALLIGGVLAGAGGGLAYRAAIGSVLAMTEPAARGEALAGLFLGGYAGMSLPVVGLGLLLLVTTLNVAIIVFSALLACLLCVSLVITLRTRGAR